MKFWKNQVVDRAMPGTQLGMVVPVGRTRRQPNDVRHTRLLCSVEHVGGGGDLVLDQRCHEEECVDAIEQRRPGELGEIEWNDVGGVWQGGGDVTRASGTDPDLGASRSQSAADLSTDCPGRPRHENPH